MFQSSLFDLRKLWKSHLTSDFRFDNKIQISIALSSVYFQSLFYILYHYSQQTIHFQIVRKLHGVPEIEI